MIHKALQKGQHGGHYCIVDAGKMTQILNEAANGKRIPEWVLPDVDPDTRRRLRPDILRIKGLRHNATAEEIERAFDAKEHTIQIIEVGYGPDTRWKETLARKQTQHAQLKQLLEAAGWQVEEHFVILGRAGSMFRHTQTTLIELGLTKEQAVKLMGKLHIHAVLLLRDIVIARRRLERQSRGKAINKSGIG